MAKRQTRRSISVKGVTYQRLKHYCDAHRTSVSGFLEELIAQRLNMVGAPMPVPPPPPPMMHMQAHPPAPPMPQEPEDIVSQHFTF